MGRRSRWSGGEFPAGRGVTSTGDGWFRLVGEKIARTPRNSC